MRLGTAMVIGGSATGAFGAGFWCFMEDLIARHYRFYPFTLVSQDLLLCKALGLCLAVLGGALVIGGLVRMAIYKKKEVTNEHST